MRYSEPLRAALKPALDTARGFHRRRTLRMTQVARMQLLFERYADQLVPGRWRQVGRIAFREGLQMPLHLERTVVDRERDGRTIAERLHHVSGSAASSNRTVEAIIAGGMTILYAPSDRAFSRIAEHPIFDAEYKALRDAFASEVPSPHFHITRDGTMITEEALDGLPLSEFPHHVRLDLLTDLSSRFHRLAQRHSANLSDSAQTVNDLALWALHDALDASGLTRDIDQPFLAALMTHQRGAPAKGRAVGQNNLLVVGNVLHCIDFPRVATRLYWSDTLTMLLHTEPESFRAGAFDATIQRILAVGDVTFGSRLTGRQRASIILATLLAERVRLDGRALASGLAEQRARDAGRAVAEGSNRWLPER